MPIEERNFILMKSENFTYYIIKLLRPGTHDRFCMAVLLDKLMPVTGKTER